MWRYLRAVLPSITRAGTAPIALCRGGAGTVFPHIQSFSSLSANYRLISSKSIHDLVFGGRIRAFDHALPLNTARRALHVPVASPLPLLPVHARSALRRLTHLHPKVNTPATRRFLRPISTSAGVSSTSPLVAGLSDSARRAITLWVGGAAAWVFTMVVLGGVTRLTRSGLSMTDWKFTGEKPPSTEEEWLVEFSRYQQSPEFQKVNSSMTVDEFKFIYWMEWAHRMWGRGLGVYFAIPFAYFASRGQLNAALTRRLLIIFGAGGAQGFIGWWMVKSGLEHPPQEWDVPRVSPYRLATHLTSAFAIYAALLWTTLTLAMPTPLAATIEGSAVPTTLRVLRGRALPLTGLVALTAFSGAYVAGMDAGHAYNDFPFMNGDLIPVRDYFVMEPLWRNFFESTAAVQFNHRVLALTTLGSVGAFFFGAQQLGLKTLPKSVRLPATGMLHMTLVQVALGIATLMWHVPVELGSAHQAGALTLLSLALATLHGVRASPVLNLSTLLSRGPLLVMPAAVVVGLGTGLMGVARATKE